MTLAIISDNTTPPKGFMSQSTIYKRNEARVAKTYALKNDTRPAFVRVLSALSLSRAPSPQSRKQITQVQPDFSQETVFSTSSDLLATSSTRTSPSPVTNVFVFASVGGAASQLVFGARSAGNMLLQQSERKVAQFAFEGHANAASSVTFSAQKQMAAAKISNSQVATSACISGILFGSKAIFSRALGDEQNNTPLAASTLASSALAGASKATLSLPLQTIRSFQFMTSRPLKFSDAAASIVRGQGIQGLYNGSRMAFSSEMIGAILYFSTYEAAKSLLAPNIEKPASSVVVGVSGALAGIVYQTALHEFARCHRSVNLQSFIGAQQRIAFPSLLRTMPIHATLFLCYESAVLAAQV